MRAELQEAGLHEGERRIHRARALRSGFAWILCCLPFLLQMRCELPVLYLHGVYVERTTVRQSEVPRALVSTARASTQLRITEVVSGNVVHTAPAVGTVQPTSALPWLGAAWTRREPLPTLPPGAYRVSVPPEDLDDQGDLGDGWRTYETALLVQPDVPGSRGQVLLVVATGTWQAYNPFGGVTYYTVPHTVAVSRDRPGIRGSILPRVKLVASLLDELGYGWEVADESWLEQNPSAMAGYSLVLLLGQIEYVTRDFRELLEQHFDAGGRILAMGNEFALYQSRRVNDLLLTHKFPPRGPDAVLLDADPSNDHLATYEWARIGEPETRLFGTSTWLAGKPEGGVAQWHAHRSGHWMWAGTGVDDGTEFPMPGDHMDGTLVRFENGLPFPDQQELTETPDDFMILATAPTNWAKPWWTWPANHTACCAPGWGVVGIRQNAADGIVAVIGTNSWLSAEAFAEEPVVEQVVRNLLSTLASPDPVDAYGGYAP